ncbi:murein hydrolase activator EnvC family protein [Lyngbya confervoides]|uniref:Peptidoglycan DD-metalloendopeptidase family protein n=1 Tax=Lyngbya confervoides BDU141951 TaxID=1574623 RepID=A0ABD4T9S7_9CYAN|nr:M23 family metallopeptidase [Lyngbya confervoides]MCM1985047.1 peptidoglycan DD-metalloendopeptidase family protein [Lyngbya confervoides BDU141951]
MASYFRPLTRALWVAILAMTFLIGSGPAHANENPAEAHGASTNQASPQTWTLDDLQQRQTVVDQYRQQVNQQKEQLQQLEGAARERLGGLQKTLQATTSQLDNQQQQLQVATESLEKVQKELQTVESRYQQRREVTADRLKYLQRNRKTQNWSTLLQSQSLEDLLDKQYYLKRVYAADQRVLSGLKQEADQVNAKKVEIETRKNEIALLLQQLNSQKDQYEQQAKAQRDLVLRLNTDRRALEAAEAQLSRDSKNLSILIQQRIAIQSSYQNGKPPIPGTGQMILPTQGSVTSPFGWRIHPVLGSQRFHAGLDVGAEEGTPIVAADSGTVILAEWYGGYGYAVIIDHGNNITTLYGHCSQLFVTVGQSVNKGELIAAVGSTGLSTGPHLHFEVRIKGEPMDPVAFL